MILTVSRGSMKSVHGTKWIMVHRSAFVATLATSIETLDPFHFPSVQKSHNSKNTPYHSVTTPALLLTVLPSPNIQRRSIILITLSFRLLRLSRLFRNRLWLIYRCGLRSRRWCRSDRQHARWVYWRATCLAPTVCCAHDLRNPYAGYCSVGAGTL